MKRRRRTSSHTNLTGIEVNSIIPNQRVSRKKYYVSLYDCDSLAVRFDSGEYKRVSINASMRRLNNLKPAHINTLDVRFRGRG